MSDGGSQLNADIYDARILALNATLGGEPESEAEMRARRRGIERYARYLLYRLGWDVQRLERLADGLRESSRQDESKWYSEAVELVETAVQMVRDTGVEQLRTMYEEPHEESSPPGLLDRHRLIRRVLRRFSPIWWYHRWWTRRHVQFLPGPGYPVGLKVIKFRRGHVEIGSLKYATCDACRYGYVYKIEVDYDFEGRGIASRGLKLARQQAPSYRWHTTPQYDTAHTYWKLVGRRSRKSYTAADPCEHIVADIEGPAPPTGDLPFLRDSCGFDQT